MEAGSKDRPPMLAPDSLRSQLETQKTQFVNEIDRISTEYYYADHMNAILGVYTELDEDLKAQLQDKGIVISELKKLIDKQKGKSVDTKFEKSSVIRQPNAFKSQRPSVLGKPNIFSNSFLLDIVLFIVDSGYSKHMMGNLKLLINFVEKKSTYFIRDLKGNDLLTEGILHQTSVARTPEQNGVVERWNRTLVEAARTMLSAAKVPLDGENLDKIKEKGDECIFVGYSTQSRAYRVFNKRTRVIMESIHVNFDELPHMESDQLSSDPAPECQSMALNHESLSPVNQRQANFPQEDRTVTMSNELDLLFSLMFDEFLNGSSKVVSKSSAVSAADAPYHHQQRTTPLNIHTTPAPTYDEFINIFSTPVQDQGETSSRHVDSSNMHTFYQRYPSEHRWTKDHPLEQVIGNPSQSVKTRRQLESDAEMCMFAFTEELHQFDRLDALVQNSTDPALTRQAMASVQNSTDPGLSCQAKASVQISSDPAPKCQKMALEHNSLSPGRNCQANVSHGDKTGTTSIELDFLFSPMFDELLNGSSKVVSKSSAVAATDAPNQRQQPTTPLNTHTTPVPTCQNPPI
nr:hypothetical protein [Tanacetum cinerariifolium]